MREVGDWLNGWVGEQGNISLCAVYYKQGLNIWSMKTTESKTHHGAFA